MKKLFISVNLLLLFTNAFTQKPVEKKISKDLVGIFFEDISYAADGGLYAELIQNRSFEYSPTSRKTWHSLSYWNYVTDGFAYGQLNVESSHPLHFNNPHYAVLTVEDPGQKGMGLSNSGFDGIVVRKNAQYNFSVFIQKLSKNEVPLTVSIQNKKGVTLGSAEIKAQGDGWKQYTATIKVNQDEDSAQLVLLAKAKGKLALDMISLFPEQTFKNRKNGMRADLAASIAALHPKFMRFPGGCLVHGDGLGNMYLWKNTIGPVEQRVAQKNIWNYHQTVGLGYFEYFQFCEDIGAKPLPVVPAAVSCQNSGGTWRIGGTGQKGLPLDEMDAYIQDLLDLIEYANGSVSSEWGAKRAAAGHPAPFHLQYIGVGNEDKMTPVFKERFQQIYDVLKTKHPEITVIGTVGPASEGEDFEKGWQYADEWKLPMVDEHYYMDPSWFLHNHHRYDSYDRKRSKVYLGEYASRGNKWTNALAEAAFMIGLERNGDVVQMASYAPLLANIAHTSWNPNLIYFNNVTVSPTVNYYIQQLFSQHAGDLYYSNIIHFTSTKANTDTVYVASCVKDKETGDLILKFVNAGSEAVNARIDLSSFKRWNPAATLYSMSGQPTDQNMIHEAPKVLPTILDISITPKMTFTLPAYSFQVIRIQSKK